jgi:hypothetical protein
MISPSGVYVELNHRHIISAQLDQYYVLPILPRSLIFCNMNIKFIFFYEYQIHFMFTSCFHIIYQIYFTLHVPIGVDNVLNKKFITRIMILHICNIQFSLDNLEGNISHIHSCENK